ALERQLNLAIGQKDQMLTWIFHRFRRARRRARLAHRELYPRERRTIDAHECERAEPIVAPGELEGRRFRFLGELVAEAPVAQLDHERIARLTLSRSFAQRN